VFEWTFVTRKCSLDVRHSRLWNASSP